MLTDISSQDRPATSAGGPWATDGKKSASRLRGARRRSIPHLVLGVLLVLSCAAAAVVMSSNARNRQSVLALARTVPVGHTLTSQDLKQVNVAVDSEVSVVNANQAGSVLGKTMSTSLPIGALLTPEAVGGAGVPPAGQAITSLSLKAGQFPLEVSSGAHVSVVLVPGQPGTVSANPPTLESTTQWPAVVTSVTSTQQTTVVSVQLNPNAARQIAAVPTGQLSIVMLAGSGR